MNSEPKTSSSFYKAATRRRLTKGEQRPSGVAADGSAQCNQPASRGGQPVRATLRRDGRRRSLGHQPRSALSSITARPWPCADRLKADRARRRRLDKFVGVMPSLGRQMTTRASGRSRSVRRHVPGRFPVRCGGMSLSFERFVTMGLGPVNGGGGSLRCGAITPRCDKSFSTSASRSRSSKRPLPRSTAPRSSTRKWPRSTRQTATGETLGADEAEGLGTGPYDIVYFEPGSTLTMERSRATGGVGKVPNSTRSWAGSQESLPAK